MIYFRWNEKYSVGIAEIDAQHRHLVKMVNDLYEAMYAGQGREALGKILSGLIRYTQTHFQIRSMQSINRFTKKWLPK